MRALQGEQDETDPGAFADEPGGYGHPQVVDQPGGGGDGCGIRGHVPSCRVVAAVRVRRGVEPTPQALLGVIGQGSDSTILLFHVGGRHTEVVDFFFVSDHLALDFAATLTWRTTHPIDLLAEPADLAAWATQAGLTDHPGRVSRAALDRARQLREAVYRTASRRSRARMPPWPTYG